MPAAHYYPFASGSYSTAPGLHKLETDFGNGALDRQLFQLDQNWFHYHHNKLACREESIHKYYQEHKLSPEAGFLAAKFILRHLLQDYPRFFVLDNHHHEAHLKNILSGEIIVFNRHNHTMISSGYINLLDALVSQIQEDVAIWQLEDDCDFMSLIHLCAPNHWAAEDKIGKAFSTVHAPVADMSRMKVRYKPMLHSLTRAATFVRFAWGLATDRRLNHHPHSPEGVKPELWQGRQFDPEHPQLWVRVERQTLSGLLEGKAVFFTIRTYFEKVAELSKVQQTALVRALHSMSAESLKYKGLTAQLDMINQYLNGL